MDPASLLDQLLRAESEDLVLELLTSAGFMDASSWRELGGLENNFGIVANQQQDATGAFVEKIINALDANLMRASFEAGLAPDGPDAPDSMAAAVERFFGVPKGRIGDLTTKERRSLAELTQVVATGSKTDPSYLIIDRGEGQTPAMQPATFLSLAKSNKMRIPFVQGKFNSGGTGVLPFCGKHNVQLIASKRCPAAPVAPDDITADEWGFTVVRRLRPAAGRRNSVFVYLAPGGDVLSFKAPSIMALPLVAKSQQPLTPYAAPLEFGSVIKLYNYRWNPKSIATTEMRYELERFLHSPCLPFLVAETRDYRGHYFAAPVMGVWAGLGGEDEEENARLERGFPASSKLNLQGIGPLPYVIALFTEDTNTRRVPHGVHFAINGQSHGQLPQDFIKRIGHSYLDDDVLVSVDCTGMEENVREDFFMASRDRLRRNEAYYTVVASLTKELKDHPGLAQANAVRRTRKLEQSLKDQEDVTKTFNDLLSADPALQALFNLGDRLVASTGPSEVEKFSGRRFPTFFKLQSDPKSATLVKPVPVNRTCRVEFLTDAVNDYFDRIESPGEMTIEPSEAFEHGRLWNGVYVGRFRAPLGAIPGEVIEVVVQVTDPERDQYARDPFVSRFVMKVEPELVIETAPGPPVQPRKPAINGKHAPRLAIPNVTSVRKEEWETFKPPFDAETAFRVVQVDQSFDFFVNLDCRHLLGYLKGTKDDEKELVVYWFKWGLTLCSLGLLHGFGLIGKAETPTPKADERPDRGRSGDYEEAEDPIDTVNKSVNGIGAVIIPIIKNLYHPLAAAALV